MNFLLAAFFAFVLSYAATPLAIRLAKKMGLVDDPAHRRHPARTHQGIIPRAGGLSLLAAVAIASLIFLPGQRVILTLLLTCCFTVLMGLWDDYKDISPYVRFIGNIVTALLIIGAGVGIPFITNPLGGIIPLDTWRISFSFFGTHSILVWADIFALIWIVWTMNIVGWSAGVDGQMPGFVVITAAVLGMMSLRFSAHDISQQVVATLAFITAGAFLGFLPWNFYPQKIMPGYGGKTLGGLLIAVIAILSGGKVGSALLLLAIPMIDAAFLLMRRITSKKSPFRADRNHLHHYLLDLGWSKPKVALFYWSVSILFGIVALSVTSSQKVFVFLMAVIIFGTLLYAFSKMMYKEKEETI